MHHCFHQRALFGPSSALTPRESLVAKYSVTSARLEACPVVGDPLRLLRRGPMNAIIPMLPDVDPNVPVVLWTDDGPESRSARDVLRKAGISFVEFHPEPNAPGPRVPQLFTHDGQYPGFNLIRWYAAAFTRQFRPRPRAHAVQHP